MILFCLVDVVFVVVVFVVVVVDAVFAVLTVDVVVYATLKVILRLIMMEVEFGWWWWWGGGMQSHNRVKPNLVALS